MLSFGRGRQSCYAEGMQIRPYRCADAAALARLYYETVRSVNLADYSQAEVEAWAPAIPDTASWNGRLIQGRTLVAEDETGLLGFCMLEPEGCVDLLYVRKDVVRRGIGAALLERVEALARGLGLTRLWTEASRTARPFFERNGYRFLQERVVERFGVKLTNFEMEKTLPSETTRPGAVSR
jgi:putative acetyltransferase